MTEIGEEILVTATIKAKGETEQGFDVTVEIPVFKSQYPTVLTRVKPEDAAKLPLGKTLTIVIKRENLKKGKDGKNAFWDFYWGFVRVGKDGEDVKEPQRAQGSDSRDRSIQRQTALKEAMSPWHGTGQAPDTGLVLTLATAFADWLEDGRNPPWPAVKAQPAPADAGGPAKEGQPVPLTRPEFWDQAAKLGFKGTMGVAKGLGMTLDAWLQAKAGRTEADALKELAAMAGGPKPKEAQHG